MSRQLETIKKSKIDITSFEDRVSGSVSIDIRFSSPSKFIMITVYPSGDISWAGKTPTVDNFGGYADSGHIKSGSFGRLLFHLFREEDCK